MLTPWPHVTLLVSALLNACLLHFFVDAELRLPTATTSSEHVHLQAAKHRRGSGRLSDGLADNHTVFGVNVPVPL